MPINLRETHLKLRTDFKELFEEISKSSELLGEMDDDLKKVGRSIERVSDVSGLKRINKEMNTLREYAGLATKEFDKQEKTIRKKSKAMRLLSATAASLAGNVGSNLVFALQDSIVNLVKTGIEVNRLETRFVAFSDSVGAGRMQLQQYFEIAQRLGVDYVPLIELGTQFRAVGFEAEEAADLIERLTIAAGGSVEAVDGIGRSLRQIRAGKVELEELNPIAEAGVPIFKLLADELGITEKALRGLLGTGDVTRETFFKAFRTFTNEGSKARNAAVATSKEISASLERLGNEAQKLSKIFIDTFEGTINNSIKGTTSVLEEAQKALIAFGNISRDSANNLIRAGFNEQFEIGPGRQLLGQGAVGNTQEEAQAAFNTRLKEELRLRAEIVKEQERGGARSLLRTRRLQMQLETWQDIVRVQAAWLNYLKEANKEDEPAPQAEGLSDNQKELNSFIKETEKLENQRLITIKGIRREQELGLLKEEEAKTRIDTINIKAVQDLIKLNDAITEHADKLTEVERTSVAWDATITKVANEQARIAALVEQQKENLIGLVEQYMLYNQGSNIQANAHQSLIEAEIQIEQIERNRLETIQRINAELDAGTITYEKSQEKIKEANEDAIIDSNLIFINVKKMADTLGDPNLKSRFISLFTEGKQEAIDLLRVTRQIQRSLGDGQDRPLERGDAGREDVGGPSISEGGGTALGNNFEFGQGTWWKEIADFADSESFSRIEEGINIAIEGFDALGQIIASGANAELDALNLKLKELQEENRIERERIKEAYEEEIESIQNTFDMAMQNAEILRNTKIADAQAELKEGKLTAKQLAEEKQKFEREHATTVKKLNDDAKKQRAEAKKQRKEDLKELKNAEIDIQNEIRQKKYAADIQAFHFNQALRYSQIFIEGAIAFVRAIPNPFAMFAAAASTATGAAIISAATPPPKPGPIPKYAEGGYVDKPTLLIAGEGGEGEYIIPESQIGHYSGMPSITVNVEGSVLTNGEELVELIEEKVKEMY